MSSKDIASIEDEETLEKMVRLYITYAFILTLFCIIRDIIFVC